MTVFFHGNFGLHRERMAKLAKAAIENPALEDDVLAAPFGYGAPFAATYRSWLHKTGMAERGRPFQLTEYGKIALRRDPAFSAPVTMWLLHHELTSDPERAETWHFFMGEFRSKHTEFSKAELTDGLMMKLRSHSEKHFGPMSKMNPIIVRKLIECYTAPTALGGLDLLRSVGKDRFAFGSIHAAGPWSTPSALEAAYRAAN
ncbi:MAG: DUF4007 family protein [Parvularcula sp.]|jgi:hypothetical protein|nr:DUF4007 family protein [Parvularcula sp.]